jgi:excisionase family DNA binding protein
MSYVKLCGMELTEEYYTVAEVAAIIRTSKMTVYRMCADGTVESRRMGRGRMFRIPKRAVAALLPETDAK